MQSIRYAQTTRIIDLTNTPMRKDSLEPFSLADATRAHQKPNRYYLRCPLLDRTPRNPCRASNGEDPLQLLLKRDRLPPPTHSHRPANPSCRRKAGNTLGLFTLGRFGATAGPQPRAPVLRGKKRPQHTHGSRRREPHVVGDDSPPNVRKPAPPLVDPSHDLRWLGSRHARLP